MSQSMPLPEGAPKVLVIMGVSGSGKTTVAVALAARLGWPYMEGDSLHPAANVEKMRSGHALTDEDRWPWLDAVATWIRARIAAGEPGIITCSALRRVYRERIMQPGARLVYLSVPREVLTARLAARKGHYMPASLLDSQLATLEEPTPDEHPMRVDATEPTEASVAAIIEQIGQPAR